MCLIVLTLRMSHDAEVVLESSCHVLKERTACPRRHRQVLKLGVVAWAAAMFVVLSLRPPG